MEQFGDNNEMDNRAKMDIMMKFMIEMKDRMDKQDREREKERKEKENANKTHKVPKRKKSWNSDPQEAPLHQHPKKSRKNDTQALSDNRRNAVLEEREHVDELKQKDSDLQNMVRQRKVIIFLSIDRID